MGLQFLCHIIDISGNNNGKLDFGESVTLTIDLLNTGPGNASNVDVSLETSDQYVSITDEFELYE